MTTFPRIAPRRPSTVIKCHARDAVIEAIAAGSGVMSSASTAGPREALAAMLDRSPLFTSWVDPVSRVKSHILTRRIAPIQQSFYFTNSGFSGDGRYLWFYCAFPPAGDAYYGRQLAVADLAEEAVRHFPETSFADASPFVDEVSGEAYWTSGLGVWKRGPGASEGVVPVGQFPAELARRRRPLRIATHLSRSVDGRAFAIDAQIGNEWYVGDLALDGTAAFRLWEKFDLCHNHAQFSPTDPNLLLIAQDGWIDPSTGAEGRTHDRLWLLRHGQPARPVLPHAPLPSSSRGHEWWSADGRQIWFVDYREGTARVDVATGHRTLVWANGHTHSHGDRSGNFLVGDIHADGDGWRVAFFNTITRREVDIVSRLLPTPVARRSYHVHPHPRFCLGDRYICYTTNVLGRVDVALVAVEPLIELTSHDALT